jgi:hypothetical protein
MYSFSIAEFIVLNNPNTYLLTIEVLHHHASEGMVSYTHRPGAYS